MQRGHRELDGISGDKGQEMTDQSWMSRISSSIEHAHQLYHRLILVTGPASAGRDVAKRLELRRVNVSVELGERLLNLSARRRPLQVGRLLEEIVGKEGEDVILLDHLEILFEESLKQDPLRLLQGISRSRTVVAVWSGILEDGSLIYAVPGHPEHRRYPAKELLLVTAETSGDADGQA